MDPFTQRMLERARARQEKIDQKLANSGQVVSKRKPLAENVGIIQSQGSPAKSPAKTSRESLLSPRKSSKESIKLESPVRSPKRSLQKSDQAVVPSPQRPRNDVVVTKNEFKSPKRGSLNRRNSDVSVEINIMHRNDIQIEVQVEEREAPISVTYDTNSDSGSDVTVKEIKEDTSKLHLDKESIDMAEQKAERSGLRHNIKSRLDRLGNLYSDKPTLSSPIHRTELEFTSATPPSANEVKQTKPMQKDGKKKFGRLAALADEINNWEDDLTHHTFQPEPTKKSGSKNEKHDTSILDVSIHSVKDINRVLQTKTNKTPKPVNNHTYTKSSAKEGQRLDKKIVAELESKCASTTPSADSAPKMATMVVSTPPANPTTVTKKPSIKKYRAPTPPRNTLDENDESDKDKENNVVQRENNENDATECCIQTKPELGDDTPATEKGSPAVKKLAPKLNSNIDRNSVLSKAAMFEAGSPRAKEKDPAEMTLRERKALFEKNKGAAIIPKAPFGLAPSVKTLHGENKAEKPVRPVVQTSAKTTPTKSNTSGSRSNSKENLPEDNVSQSSLGGGIKGKLAALFNKEQTISEASIANKFKQEREKEMEMLQNRFHYKPKQQKPEQDNDSDDDQSEHDPSEKAPLMGSSISLAQNNKRAEIIANVPKVTFDDKTQTEVAPSDDKEVQNKESEKVVGTQPVKRRSSQDSPIVLSVLDDVKRIKVNNNKKDPNANGAVLQQPTTLYPHLSDIETDTSNYQEEYSDCGGSRCGHYALECVFFFLCI